MLNSLFFAFTNSFLPKYRVKYYDYIIKWCSGIYCNWCVSMDIDSSLALRHGSLTVMQLGIIVLGQLLKLCHAWYVFCAAHIITYRCTKFSQLDR